MKNHELFSGIADLRRISLAQNLDRGVSSQNRAERHHCCEISFVFKVGERQKKKLSHSQLPLSFLTCIRVLWCRAIPHFQHPDHSGNMMSLAKRSEQINLVMSKHDPRPSRKRHFALDESGQAGHPDGKLGVLRRRRLRHAWSTIAALPPYHNREMTQGHGSALRLSHRERRRAAARRARVGRPASNGPSSAIHPARFRRARCPSARGRSSVTWLERVFELERQAKGSQVQDA